MGGGETHTLATLYHLSGRGHFDMPAYADYHAGTLADQDYDEQELATALAGLPAVPPTAAA